MANHWLGMGGPIADPPQASDPADTVPSGLSANNVLAGMAAALSAVTAESLLRRQPYRWFNVSPALNRSD
jgi:hypothetical protein